MNYLKKKTSPVLLNISLPITKSHLEEIASHNVRVTRQLVPANLSGTHSRSAVSDIAIPCRCIASAAQIYVVIVRALL